MPHKSPRRYLRWFYLWHRRLGIVAALLFVILVITGIMLNHTSELKLAERAVTANGLLAWYGMKPPAARISFKASGHFISQMQDELFFDDRPLPIRGQLMGAVILDPLVFVVTQTAVLALLDTGETVEMQSLPAALSGQVRRVGVQDSKLFIDAGTQIMSMDADMQDWTAAKNSSGIQWISPSALPSALEKRLRRNNSPLSWERVLLDLHSGRLFGRYGVYVMDAAALILLLLSLSGSYLWWQHHRRRKHHSSNSGSKAT